MPHAIQRHRDVDDDFTIGRLLRFFVLLDVRSAGVADPAGDVQKADTRNGKLTQVFQVPVDDQVRQTVSAAEQTSFAVVLEALTLPRTILGPESCGTATQVATNGRRACKYARIASLAERRALDI